MLFTNVVDESRGAVSGNRFGHDGNELGMRRAACLMRVLFTDTRSTWWALGLWCVLAYGEDTVN
jgi:hypothetical protein